MLCVAVRYDTARRLQAVGPMGRGRELDDTLSPPPVRSTGGGETVELSRAANATITRLQGMMCLFGVDTPTLVEW